MADDIDDLLNCIEKKMNTRLKTWDSDDDDGVKASAPCHANKTTSDKCHRKYARISLSVKVLIVKCAMHCTAFCSSFYWQAFCAIVFRSDYPRAFFLCRWNTGF